MGLLHSRLTARRFRVAGTLPDGFRESYRDQLEAHMFKDFPSQIMSSGWTIVHDITDTDFEDFNKWLMNGWILFGLRVDKRVLPAKLFKAEVDRVCKMWAEERELERVPAAVRKELKEEIETKWLARVVPRMQHYEIAWNLDTNMAYLSAHGDSVSDQVRKLFFRTFGRKMVTYSPLEWIKDDDSLLDQMISSQPMRIAKVAKDVQNA